MFEVLVSVQCMNNSLPSFSLTSLFNYACLNLLLELVLYSLPEATSHLMSEERSCTIKAMMVLLI